MNPREFQNETEAAEAEAWTGAGCAAASGSHSVPQRIQLRRVKGWKMPDNTVIVSRPHKWGNPFVVGEWSDRAKLGYQTPVELCGVLVRDNAHAAELFEKWIHSLSDVALAWRISAHVLRGLNLACWCPLWRCENGHQFGNDIKSSRVPKYCPKCGGFLHRAACHADTLLQLANK
jgi:hypothetical protein